MRLWPWRRREEGKEAKKALLEAQQGLRDAVAHRRRVADVTADAAEVRRQSDWLAREIASALRRHA